MWLLIAISIVLREFTLSSVFVGITIIRIIYKTENSCVYTLIIFWNKNYEILIKDDYDFIIIAIKNKLLEFRFYYNFSIL